MEPFIFLDTTSFRDFKVVHYCRLFEHRVARWTYLPNYIFGSSIGYAVASILPIDPVASVAIVTTAISSYALRKPIAITLLLLMFSRLIYYCPCLVLLSGMPFHSQNITKIKLIKIGNGDESSTVYFYYTSLLQ